MTQPDIARLIKILASILFTLCANGCTPTLQPQAFAGTSPVFDPVTFWTGKTTSWGVVENSDGAPTAIITTSTVATPEGKNGLHMIQQIVNNGERSTREWHILRLGNNQFQATANDVIGTACGVASGRTFHWTWSLATQPGNPISNVTLEQWMYLADNGTLMNRTIITKLGLRLAQISEQFVRGN